MTEKTETCLVPGCERPEVGDAPGWCAEHRALFDAQSEREAWEWAREILAPWTQTARMIGSDELTLVMERALLEVGEKVSVAADAWERAGAVADRPTGSMTDETSNEYRTTLEELAHSRGFSGAEEVARLAAEFDPRYTVRELLERPPGGYGAALDAVLDLNDAERSRITRAFMKTFMNPSRLERLASDGDRPA